MLSSLSAYLFGNYSGDTPSTDDGAASQSNPLDQSNTPDNIKLKVVPTETEEDEDWLIVDKDGEEEESLPQTDSEEEIPFVEIKRQRPGTSRHQRVGSGSALSITTDGISLAQGMSQYGISTASCMGESWFLTPPPCFTSTGPIDMVTSPFENLLIEHPSMSVYHRIRTVRQSQMETNDSMAEYDFGMGLENMRPQIQPHPIAERSPVRTTRVVVPRRVERIEILTQQQTKEITLSRNAQKVHEKKARQILCRGAIKRSNKVREINSKGGRPRRSDMQHCKVLSGANNNRKC